MIGIVIFPICFMLYDFFTDGKHTIKKVEKEVMHMNAERLRRLGL